MIPDYSTYSLEELVDALNHIDKVQYSDRVKIIKKELKKRESLKEKENRQVDNNERKSPTDSILRTPETLNDAREYIFSNLQILILGIFFCFIDISFEISFKDIGIKRFDILTDLIGLFIIFTAIYKLQVLPTSNRFKSLLRKLKFILFFLIIASFIDLLRMEDNNFEIFLSDSMNIAEAIGLIIFCYSMKQLSFELKLNHIKDQWNWAIILYWVYGILISIVTLVELFLLSKDNEIGFWVIASYITMITIFSIFIIAFCICIYIIYKMKKEFNVD